MLNVIYAGCYYTEIKCAKCRYSCCVTLIASILSVVTVNVVAPANINKIISLSWSISRNRHYLGRIFGQLVRGQLIKRQLGWWRFVEVLDACHNLRTSPEKLCQVLLSRTFRISKSDVLSENQHQGISFSPSRDHRSIPPSGASS